MAEGFERFRDRGWRSEATCSVMRSAVGVRNVSANESRKLDWNIVHRIASHRIARKIPGSFVRKLQEAGLIEI